MMSRPNLLFIVGLSLYTLSMRLMPYGLNHFGVEIEPPTTFYPWNFSPMAAFCLFGAAYYAKKYWAYLLPVGILFAGDLGIWALSGNVEWAFHKNMVTVYACYLFIATIGMVLRYKRTIPLIVLTGISGEILFFLITNFGTWYFSPTYAHNAQGLMECYLLALPFFGKSLSSTLFFSAVIFSPYLYRERKAAALATNTPSVVA